MKSLSSRKWLVAILIGASILPFQNCGKGISTATEETLISQCFAKIRASAKSLSGISDPSCDQDQEFTCERRVFSPDLLNSVTHTEECSASGCVQIETRVFNTQAARDSAGAEEFAPGGEYNREEVNCAHRSTDKGIALFVGHGDTMTAALAQARSACRGETL